MVSTFDRGRLDGTAPQSWQLAVLLSMLALRSDRPNSTHSSEICYNRTGWHTELPGHNFGPGQSSLCTQLALDQDYAPSQVRAMIIALVVVEVWSIFDRLL